MRTHCIGSVIALLLATGAVAQTEEAERLFASQDWEGAARAYAQITETDPGNGRAWLRLGVALTSLGRYDEAIAALQKADSLSWLPSITLFQLARAQALALDEEGALRSLERALEAGYSSLDAITSDEAFRDLRADPAFQEIAAKARVAAEPCEHAEEFRQFDFWIGEWVVSSGGALAGENRIERLERGCLLMENWTSAGGGSGKSMNFYDPAKKTWNQVWVDASGSNIVASGSFHDGAMHFEGEHHYLGASSQRYRMSFTARPDGTVRQFIEQSQDDGKTWYVWFDGIYERKK
jgi:tetratricopeptide (TPR) repeat protein